MQRKHRTLLIWALVIALGVTTVAYAALQATLNITGNIIKSGGTWDVSFSDLTIVSGESYFKTKPSANGTNLAFAVELPEVGDSVEMRFRVHNNGTLNAVVKSNNIRLAVGSGYVNASSSEAFKVSNKGISCQLTDDNGNLTYNYSNQAYSLLSSVNAGKYTDYVRLKCTYEELSSWDETVNVSFSIVYQQNV